MQKKKMVIKISLMEAGWADTNYVELDQNRVYWRVFVFTAMEL
jgi:hypothetical protein